MMALHWFTLLVSSECGYPKWLAFFMLPQNFFIFILFYDFYRKAYNKKSKVNENGAKTALNNDVDEENDSKYVDLLKKKKKLNEDFNDEKINA